MSLELRLHVYPTVLSFVDWQTRPIDAPNSLPWLMNSDDLALNARSSTLRATFSNQNASLKVVLKNEDKRAALLLGRPLRCRAEMFKNAVLYFAGLVQLVDYGP